MGFKIKHSDHVSPTAFKAKRFQESSKSSRCVFKMKRLGSTAQRLEHWPYKNERLRVGETMGLAPLSLGRTCGRICSYATEFLLELLLQFVLIWQD